MKNLHHNLDQDYHHEETKILLLISYQIGGV